MRSAASLWLLLRLLYPLVTVEKKVTRDQSINVLDSQIELEQTVM